MPDRLELVKQRVKRAKEQRCDIEREMRAWCEIGAYRVVSEFDPRTGYTPFYLREAGDVTPLVSALMGEIIHSLRTSLDHLAYQMFLACRTDPTDDGSRIEFPIYDDTKTKESKAFGPIKTLRKEMIEAVRMVNPCKSGDSLLWTLHRLDIINKHRRIITSYLVHSHVFVGDAMRGLVSNSGYGDMVQFAGLRPAFVTTINAGRKAQVGDVVFVGAPGDEKVNEKLQFTFDIAFDEPGLIEGKSVIETIDGMIKRVDDIASDFAPLLL
jgi:hypothetical protein